MRRHADKLADICKNDPTIRDEADVILNQVNDTFFKLQAFVQSHRQSWLDHLNENNMTEDDFFAHIKTGCPFPNKNVNTPIDK